MTVLTWFFLIEQAPVAEFNQTLTNSKEIGNQRILKNVPIKVYSKMKHS